MKICNKHDEQRTYWKNNLRLFRLQMLLKEKYESNLQLLFHWNSSQDCGCDEELPGLRLWAFCFFNVTSHKRTLTKHRDRTLHTKITFSHAFPQCTKAEALLPLAKCRGVRVPVPAAQHSTAQPPRAAAPTALVLQLVPAAQSPGRAPFPASGAGFMACTELCASLVKSLLVPKPIV